MKTLRDLAGQKQLQIGAAVGPELLKKDAEYERLVKDEFSCLVAENCMKFRYLQPEMGQFDFREGDQLAEFAEQNGQQLRGHTICWHHQNPEWLEKGDFTRFKAMDLLKEHIFTVIEHFKGRVFCWDVVNEAIEDRYCSYRDKNPWFRFIGPDYIELAFRWTHEADPDCLLFYNDYDLQSIDRKFEATIELLKPLVKKGIPIHGLGFQFHTMPQDAPTKDQFLNRLRRVKDELGLICHVTEMDINVSANADKKELQFQADVYRRIVDAVIESGNCPVLVTWGVCDKYSWVPSFTKGQCDHPLLFDKNYQPKPAHKALIKLVD